MGWDDGISLQWDGGTDGISKRAACNGMVGRYQQACSLQWDGRTVSASVQPAMGWADGNSKRKHRNETDRRYQQACRLQWDGPDTMSNHSHRNGMKPMLTARL
jgi:hypothetical protein